MRRKVGDAECTIGLKLTGSLKEDSSLQLHMLAFPYK